MTNTTCTKSTLITAILSGALLALTGCAAHPDAVSTVGEPELVESGSEIVSEIEAAEGVKLTFSLEVESADGSGDPVVAITELGPINAPRYLARLRDLGATSLESFLALAPEGTEAPSALRGAHAREAARLGRSAEVRGFSLVTLANAATSDSAACDSYAAFTNSVDDLDSVQTSSSIGNHSLTFQNGGYYVTAAMCNHDSNRVDYKYAQFCLENTVQGSPVGWLSCDPKIIVPDGHRVSKLWVNATSDRLVRAQELENYALTVTSYIAIGAVPPTP